VIAVTLIVRAEPADEAVLFLGGAGVVEGDEAGEQFREVGIPACLFGGRVGSGRTGRNACFHGRIKFSNCRRSVSPTATITTSTGIGTPWLKMKLSQVASKIPIRFSSW
jgi:hypothetical protein